MNKDAMDNLIKIVKINKNWNNSYGRVKLLEIFNNIGSNN